MDTTFRSISPVSNQPSESGESEFVENKVGAEVSDIPEPVDSENSNNVILDVIGLDDDFKDLPSEEQTNVNEIANFVQDLIRAKGKSPTALSFAKEVDNLKSEVGLDYDAEPTEVISRLSGVIKSYKNLAFLSDKERKSVFMKLARMPDTKSMNELVFKEMTNKKIWQ